MHEHRSPCGAFPRDGHRPALALAALGACLLTGCTRYVESATHDGGRDVSATHDQVTRRDHARDTAKSTDAPADHAPADHAPADHAPADHAPADHAPADHAPADHAPADHAPADHAPADHAQQPDLLVADHARPPDKGVPDQARPPDTGVPDQPVPPDTGASDQPGCLPPLIGSSCVIDLSMCSEAQKASAWKGMSSLPGTIILASYLSTSGLMCMSGIGQAWPLIAEPSWWCGQVPSAC